MEKDELKKELKVILIRSVFLDIAAYLISTFFVGFTLQIAAGLFLGTAGMLLNLFLLNKSVYSAVRSGGAGGRMFAGYMIRLSIVAVIFIVASFVSLKFTAAALIPYFYPKLIYAGKTLFRKEEKSE